MIYINMLTQDVSFVVFCFIYLFSMTKSTVCILGKVNLDIIVWNLIMFVQYAHCFFYKGRKTKQIFITIPELKHCNILWCILSIHHYSVEGFYSHRCRNTEHSFVFIVHWKRREAGICQGWAAIWAPDLPQAANERQELLVECNYS